MTDERASPAGLESNQAPLWKRALPIIGALAIVVFIFGWVLPEFIGYDAALRAIKNRWHLGLGAGLTAQLAGFVVLFLSLRFVGIGSD